MRILKSQKHRELINHGVDGILWMCPSTGPNKAFAHTLLKSVPVVVAIDRAVNSDDLILTWLKQIT
jgi:DNA-binding LacI/PurR family transcriptional regulator